MYTKKDLDIDVKHVNEIMAEHGKATRYERVAYNGYQHIHYWKEPRQNGAHLDHVVGGSPRECRGGLYKHAFYQLIRKD